MTHGDGKSTYCNYQVAKRYFDVTGAAAFAKISEVVTEYAPPLIETNAPDNVHMTMYSTSDQLILNMVNFVGVDGSFSVEPQTFDVTVDISGLQNASFVFATSPGLTDAESIPFTIDGTQLSFEITVDKYTMIIIL
jgi:hypothetical protein